MKKLLLFAVVLAATTFTSCEKCASCDYGTLVTDYEFCGDELDAAEAAGYDCD